MDKHGLIRPLVLLCALVSPVLAQEKIVYRLEYAKPDDTTVRVRMTLPGDPAAPVTMVMPRAIPMGYGEQRYDRYVTGVRASAPQGGELLVEREEGPRWRIGAAGGRVRYIEYQVDLARMEREILAASDSSRVRPGYVGLLGYSVFAYVEGWEQRPIHLEIEAPRDWPVFTTLASREPPQKGSAAADAADFYALVDSQAAMGPALQVHERQGAVPLYLAAYAEGPVDLALTGDLAAEALEKLIRYFGAAPFPHYTVHVELLKPVSPEHSYGFSMEHLDSSTYYLAADSGVTEKSTAEQRARVQFNFAHHIAHAWIPKRAYGQGYFPFSWELAPVIDTIWLSEGFARYIAIEALADGLPEAEAAAYKKRLLDNLRQTVAGIPAFIREMPLVELSRIASTRYSEDFRTGRTLFSRGALLAAELDERIRQRTAGRKRFRDAMRHLLAWSARNHRGFRIDELPGIFREATGVDTSDLWERGLK